MIVITGGAGFIGSNLLTQLNIANYKDIVLVDDFSRKEREKYYLQKQYTTLVDRNDLFKWLSENHRLVQMILHMGARTDTTEDSWAVFQELNLDYSKRLFSMCIDFGLPIIYASSAATYGSGEYGFEDLHETIPKLEPLNPYGKSKNDFDKWVLSLKQKPFFWTGLKFFNVYGPNEYHKGRMASVVYHTYQQILETGGMKLFKSHNPKYNHGEQSRDFIYVKDLVSAILFLMKERPASGIINLGSGIASTFLELVSCTFKAMNLEPSIAFIDTPEDIRSTYQYYTQANIDKLRKVGYKNSLLRLEEGIQDYVCNYLINNKVN